MDRAQQHWQARHRAVAAEVTATPQLTIALEREAGALRTSVAHELARQLDWPAYDHELLERIAQEMGLRTRLLESVDERRRSWLEESIERFSGTPLASANAYVRHLIETLFFLGAHGECVIVGRGAAQLLPAETTLRVRLIGNLEDRITTIQHRFGLSRAEAARRVEELDRERRQFVKDHFRRDPTELHQYDLILNVFRCPLEECAGLIADAARRLGHI
jgi:cytidylate kinase